MLLVAAQAPPARNPTLSIDEIMEGPEFAGTQPSEVRWSVDGQRVYFRWKTTKEKKDALYVVDVTDRTPRRLSDAEEREAPPSAGVENAARTKKLYVRDGDLYLLDLKTGSKRRITATVTDESDPELMRAFLHGLVGTTQVKGGYYVRAAQASAVGGFVERLEMGLYPLPALAAAELAARQRPPRAEPAQVRARRLVPPRLREDFAAPGD